jgi:hypothetical protein
VHHPVVIPNVRAVVRHAIPKVIEGKVVPVLLFVAFLEAFGNVWALMIALTWSLGMIAFRLGTGRRVPGLIVLSAAALIGKTIAALITGSMLVYFLQPTVTTVIVGITFLVSVPLGNPLAQRLACDVFPFEDSTRSHPLMEQFFVRLSVLWSFTSLVNAALTVWLLLTQSLTTFVLIKSILGPATGVVTVTSMFLWLRVDLLRSGTPLVWARS